jgi:hypothetical protein
MKKNWKLLALACACSIASLQALAADELLQRGVQLVEAGKGKEAYALLEPQESARAGDKDFDFLFALAALEAGQNTRAIFALERVLAQDPKNVRARAEIGRAYLAVGEVSSARAELNTVKELGVPAEVGRSIDNILSAVNRIEAESKTTVRGYVEGVFGYDTNVNASPARSEIAIPLFGNLPLTLSADSRAKADWFSSIGGGVNLRMPLSKEWSIVGGLSGSQRLNMHHERADLLNVDGNVGVVNNQGKNVYSLTLQASTLAVENDRYRDAVGLTGQWQHNLDARNQVSAFIQYADLKYTTQSVRDAERWVGGVGYAHALRDGTIGFASAYLLKEDVRNRAFSNLALDGYGLRIGGQTALAEGTILFASLAYETRRHDAQDGAFLVTRDDDQSTLSLGISHVLKRNLRITGQYQRVDQRSTIAFNEYDRDIVSLTLRHDF